MTYTTQHPIEQLAFWNTKREAFEKWRTGYASALAMIERKEVLEMIDKFTALTQGDPILEKQLLDLMDWAAHQRSCEEEYNRSEDA